MTASEISNYELKRKLNMEQNQNLLRELGLTENVGIAADIPQIETSSKKRRTKTYKRGPPKPKPATRLSRRIRGETPEEYVELDKVVDENDRIKQLEIADRKKEQEIEMVSSLPIDVYVPVTLRSIGTTIWELGELNTGIGRSKSWSNRSCKYKHPYPVGYRATKSHFGNHYTMGILPAEKEGEGPIFEVQLKSTTWKGATPTAPWTEACIRSKSSSTRVSGPLFYGFSDPITMKLIENMKGYEESGLPEDVL